MSVAVPRDAQPAAFVRTAAVRSSADINATPAVVVAAAVRSPYRLPTGVVRELVATKWHTRLNRLLKYEIGTEADAPIVQRFLREVFMPSHPLAHISRTSTDRWESDVDHIARSRGAPNLLCDEFLMLLTDDGALCGVGCFTVATLERPARTNRASIERALQTHDLTELMDAERDCRSTSVKLRNAIAQIMFTQLIERAPVDLDRLLYIDKTAVLAGYECSNLARGLLLAGIQRAKRLNIRYLSILATAAAPHHISESFGSTRVARLEYARIRYRDQPIVTESGGMADGGRCTTLYISSIDRLTPPARL